MKASAYTTAEGWPGVHWEQVVPTGETLFSRRSELHWRFGVLVGLAALGMMLGVGLPLLWAITGSLIATLVVASPEIVQALPVPGAGPDGQRPSENERTLEVEARVVRYGRAEKRWAEVALDRGSRTLWFVLMGDAGHAGRLLVRVPLVDLEELALGSDEEWLGPAGSRELREMARQGSAWVIVTQTASKGVVEIARSGGSKKEMAELHRVLTAAFVVGRTALVKRLEDMDDA
jgi:hypothetical protein